MEKINDYSINIIVKNEDEKILLVKDDDGLKLPNYNVSSGDSLELACEKIIKEFLNIDISYPKSLFYFGDPQFGNDRVDFYLSARCVSNFDITKDNKEYVWADLDEIKNCNLCDGLLKYMDEYH